MCNFLLDRHRLAITRVFEPKRNLSRHLARARAVFARVFENSEALEPDAANEFKQRFKLFVGLAWETDNERSSQCQARNSGAKFVDQVFNVRARSFPAHSL